MLKLAHNLYLIYLEDEKKEKLIFIEGPTNS